MLHRLTSLLLYFLSWDYRMMTLPSVRISSIRLPHFGYFTEPTLFGMVTAENQLVYNLDANTVQIDEGTEKGANLEKGKAFLQKLYDDLAKR